MIATKFLSVEEYADFGQWLKSLSDEDRRMYFGAIVSDDYIDQLIQRITTDPGRHNFLVTYNCTGWLGVLHLAQVTEDSIEFGISVSEQYRNLGVASDLIREGIVWARNREYKRLYLHCVRWNHAMAYLAAKHDLEMTPESNDLKVSAKLPPSSWYSIQQETADVNRRIFHLFLNKTFFPFQESCS